MHISSQVSHESSEGSSSIINPKPRVNHPSAHLHVFSCVKLKGRATLLPSLGVGVGWGGRGGKVQHVRSPSTYLIVFEFMNWELGSFGSFGSKVHCGVGPLAQFIVT